MFDMVFISYRELNAEDNWNLIRDRFPQTMRLHGVAGLHKAHIVASNMVRTPLFYVIDGDAVIEDDFKFDHIPIETEMDHVHVFRARNPINDLIYGYGAVKLLPTRDVQALAHQTWKPDMTTSINRRYKVVHRLSNVTAFDTDDFNTWRSAFRECAKLASKAIDGQVDRDTDDRLNAWCTLGYERPFGKSCIMGAKAGRAYGLANRDDINALQKINDHSWLMDRYNEIITDILA